MVSGSINNKTSFFNPAETLFKSKLGLLNIVFSGFPFYIFLQAITASIDYEGVDWKIAFIVPTLFFFLSFLFHLFPHLH